MERIARIDRTVGAWRALCLLFVVLTAFSAQANPDLRQMVVEHRLANGMKFLLVRRPAAPIFTAYVRVKAGGADERPGKTGLAHLFEHLAFKGTSVVGSVDWERERPLLLEIARVGEELEKTRQVEPNSPRIAELQARIGQLSQEERALEKENAVLEILSRNGASDLNAETDKDMTTYYVSLPSNRLELWALIEASRLANPVPRDFYSERSVVMEERRERVESSAMGVMAEELCTVAFSASPYRWPVVGYLSDLESITIRDVLNFHRELYAPANAVAAIVGDIDIEATRALLDRTFGAIPSRSPSRIAPPMEPLSRAERRSIISFDAAPQLAMAFQKPTLPTNDDYVFDVVQLVLADGRTSRLYRSLVTEHRLASDVAGMMLPGARFPHLFVIDATPLEKHTLPELEAAILTELERLKKAPVSERELRAVRNKLDADFSRQISTNAGLAESLTFFEVLAGDWRYLADHRQKVASITPADIQRVAQTYFVPENRTVVYLQHTAAPAVKEAP